MTPVLLLSKALRLYDVNVLEIFQTGHQKREGLKSDFLLGKGGGHRGSIYTSI